MAWNPATLDELPGEGDLRTETQCRERIECDYCEEPAHFKHAYLYHNYRSNPSSSGYRKDDCSWCSDVAVFTCRDCKPETPIGCGDSHATYPATERFAHMFLQWRTRERMSNP